MPYMMKAGNRKFFHSVDAKDAAKDGWVLIQESSGDKPNVVEFTGDVGAATAAAPGFSMAGVGFEVEPDKVAASLVVGADSLDEPVVEEKPLEEPVVEEKPLEEPAKEEVFVTARPSSRNNRNMK